MDLREEDARMCWNEGTEVAQSGGMGRRTTGLPQTWPQGGIHKGSLTTLGL